MSAEHPVVLWFVGPPGAGKTTLVRKLLKDQLTLIPKPKWTISGDICAAGHYRGAKFDGADTVPYNGAVDCFNYWLHELGSKMRLTILDGDRFSNERMLHLWQSTGSSTHCVELVADDELLKVRRERRGSNQNEAWMRGRATKARRFALKFPINHLRIGAGWPLDAQLAAVNDYLTGVAQ